MSAWRLRVVVPARDEEQRLPACLDALRTAVRRVRRARPTIRVSVTVALDSCLDASERIVRTTPGVQAITVRHGNVGATRAAGVARATRGDRDPARVWIACTDADTIVGPDWLVDQLRFAEAGYDAVLGTVVPDPVEAGTVAAA